MSRSLYYRVRQHRRTGVAFTLVELLVVMGVISLLLVTVLPAFKGLGRATGQRGAVGTMLGVLDRARLMAISDGLATYVVFACPTTSGSSLRPDLVGTAYAIYEDHDNINFTPEQRTPWIRLPTNVAFKIKDDNGSHASVTTEVLAANVDPAFPVNAAALASGAAANVQLPYWKFDNTGTVVNVNVQGMPQYLRVLLFSGVIDANHNEISTQAVSGPGGSVATTYYEIDVNAATGRAKFILNPQDNLATSSATPSP